jgi:hypothetical protein
MVSTAVVVNIVDIAHEIVTGQVHQGHIKVRSIQTGTHFCTGGVAEELVASEDHELVSSTTKIVSMICTSDSEQRNSRSGGELQDPVPCGGAASASADMSNKPAKGWESTGSPVKELAGMSLAEQSRGGSPAGQGQVPDPLRMLANEQASEGTCPPDAGHSALEVNEQHDPVEEVRTGDGSQGQSSHHQSSSDRARDMRLQRTSSEELPVSTFGTDRTLFGYASPEEEPAGLHAAICAPQQAGSGGGGAANECTMHEDSREERDSLQSGPSSMAGSPTNFMQSQAKASVLNTPFAALPGRADSLPAALTDSHSAPGFELRTIGTCPEGPPTQRELQVCRIHRFS